MIKNYFKIACRNIAGSKVYSAINIFGLAMGMSVALIIGLWVYNEYAFDKFLPDTESLFKVQRNFDSNGDTLTFATTSLKLADALRNQFAEIEYVAESDWMGPHGLVAGETKLYMDGGCVGSDFLKMFKFRLLQGNASNVLNDPYSIVLTQSTAKALFGSEDAIGKIVRIDNQADVKVSGVMQDLPANSSFKFNYLLPFSYLEETIPPVKSDRTGSFGDNSYQLFAKLKPGVSLAQTAPKIRSIEHTEADDDNAMNSYVILQPMENWHLYSNYENGKETAGFLEYVRMFSIIGALVLLIACINFINLTTARSEKRAKEVGVRKTMGSGRRRLIIQFLAESFLLTCIAFLFSILFVQLALPAFNALTGGKIAVPFTSPVFWFIMLLSVSVTAIAAGSRPAFYLSSFNPVKVLKGTMQVGKGAATPRKILVVLQFSCSIALIISTVIIYQQIQYAKDRPSGYDSKRLLVTYMSNDLNTNYTALKNEVLQKGIVESMTTSTSPATTIYAHSDTDWPGKNPGETVEMGGILVSDDYFKTLGMTIIEGRGFSGVGDTNTAILNEAAVKRMRLKEPVINQMIGSDAQTRVIGVVKDALMLSPYDPADPTMFGYSDRPLGVLMYRLSPHIPTQKALATLTTIFNKYNPSFPYSFEFVDQVYAAKFNTELLIGKIAGIFAALAIFISCLGLFGLAAYTAERRTKEIGIRKVLGASVSQIWMMLSKDFILLVMISSVIASSVALYFLQGWLQKYAYRINIGAGVFIISAVAAILITVITVSFQAIKAALANPAESLRTE